MAKNKDAMAVEFLDLIKELIKNELAQTDATILCRIVEANQDGTFNASIVPDSTTTIRNIKSICPETLEQGDYVYVYKFNNQLNNAIIITSVGKLPQPKEKAEVFVTANSGGGGGGGGSDVDVWVQNENLYIIVEEE